MAKSPAVAVGFRVKSGFAIAVALRAPADVPTVVARRVVELSDPAVVETRQPYHHGFYTHETDAREIARRVTIVERCAQHSVTALLEEEALAGCADAALVVGSVIDPMTVGNPHVRAHAREGQLFRTVLQSALQSHGVRCRVIVDNELGATAAAGLKRRAADITRIVGRLGKEIGGPWRADEKAAATAAWLALR
jgi:hypothetical protein